MKKAIVFAGGGSKGAYQIGVWKALEEIGEVFSIATGTSIGSINAAFYVQHEFTPAYEMWKEITADSIMVNGINFEKSFNSIYSQRDQLRPFIKKYINSKGADVTPFHNTIKAYFNPGKFASSDVDYALMTVKFPLLTPVEITKKDIVARGENGWEWIAASAAAFPVFPVKEIDGHGYIDGGYFDNIPASSAFRLGADKAVIVDLKPQNLHEGYAHHPDITYIRPSRDLGTFLNFDRQVIDRSITLGYNDTMKVYGRFFGKNFTFIPGSNEAGRYDRLGRKFIDILTQLEANHDFADAVHFKRINSYAGCTTLLWENSFAGANDCRSLFFAALEKYMLILGFSYEKDYYLPQLTANLKDSLLMCYTAESFSGEDMRKNITDYILSEADASVADLKALDDDRFMIIASALAKTLLSE